tara:strand:+ start:7851 stop:7979 length:129 start_codon:yes stop_codon:yes gene_type:complete
MSLVSDSIVKQCKKDPEYKEEILEFLIRLEEAIEEVRGMIDG